MATPPKVPRRCQSHGSEERLSFKILLTMNPRSYRVNVTLKTLLTFSIYNHWSKITSKVRETRERGKQSVQTAANLGKKIVHPQWLLQDGAAVRVLNRISREIDDLDVGPQGARLPRQFETINLRSQVWNLLEIGVIVTQCIPAQSEVLTNNEP